MECLQKQFKNLQTDDFEVNIPDNFFTQVAAMHETDEVKEKKISKLMLKNRFTIL